MNRVSEILSVLPKDFGPNQDVIELAAIRGTAVHDACIAYALGLFPVVDEDTAGYFRSFTAWWDDMVDAMKMTPETELKDEKMGYCGHPDYGHLILNNGRNTVLDLKTPVTYQRYWSLQLSAYWHLVRQATGLTVIEPSVLMLDPEGGQARMVWVEEKEGMRADQLFSLFCQTANLKRFLENGGGR